jgi:hypothetical protein
MQPTPPNKGVPICIPRNASGPREEPSASGLRSRRADECLECVPRPSLPSVVSRSAGVTQRRKILPDLLDVVAVHPRKHERLTLQAVLERTRS